MFLLKDSNKKFTCLTCLRCSSISSAIKYQRYKYLDIEYVYTGGHTITSRYLIEPWVWRVNGLKHVRIFTGRANQIRLLLQDNSIPYTEVNPSSGEDFYKEFKHKAVGPVLQDMYMVLLPVLIVGVKLLFMFEILL